MEGGKFHCVTTLTSDSEECCAVSQNADILVSCGANEIKIWNLNSGRCKIVQSTSKKTIKTISCTPTGDLIAFGSLDNTVFLYNPSTEKISNFVGHTASVKGCDINQKNIISCSTDLSLILWDIPTGNQIATFKSHRRTVNSCKFSQDGNCFVSCSSDNTVKLWDVRSGNPIQSHDKHTSEVWSCDYSHNNKIVSASSDCSLCLWDISSKTCQLIEETEKVITCCISKDGTLIAFGNKTGPLKIWELNSTCTPVTEKHSSITSVCCTYDGSKIFTALENEVIKIWQRQEVTEVPGLVEKKEVQNHSQLNEMIDRQGTIPDDVLFKGVINILENSNFNPRGTSCVNELKKLSNQPGFEKLPSIIDECEVWLESYLQKPATNPNNLSNDEIFAIVIYTHDLKTSGLPEQNFYSLLNKTLLERKIELLNCFIGYLYFLQKALSKLPNIKKKTYRGISANKKHLIQKEYIQGRKIHWSSYTSTSDDLGVAKSFARENGVIMEINILNGKSISEYSFIRGESEILMSPNMNFIVFEELAPFGNGQDIVKLVQFLPDKSFVF